MPKPTKRGEVVREWCEKHPNVPHLTLARMIYAANPKLFPNVNAVRGSVRWHRGKVSPSNIGRQVPAKPIIYTGGTSTVRFTYRAPRSLAEPLQTFDIHGTQRILRLSDIHYPFHDERALEAAVEYGIKHDPTVLLLDGDIIDCHDLSAYERNPRDRYTEAELSMLAEQFDQFRQAFPKARIIWKEGNHEGRLQKYLMRKAPELWGLPMMDVPGLLTMVGGPKAMHRVEWVANKRVLKAGHLSLLHGHELGGGGGVNPARWLFLRAGENAICGHFHRTSEHSEPSLSRKQRGAWSTGCLCDMSPGYMPHNKWNHGFAWIEVEKDGDFRVKNIRIIDGRIR